MEGKVMEGKKNQMNKLFYSETVNIFNWRSYRQSCSTSEKCNWNAGSGLKGFCSTLVCNALIGVGHIDQDCCLLQSLVWFDDFSQVRWTGFTPNQWEKNNFWDKQAMSILNIRKKKTYLHGKALLVYIFCSNYVSITTAKECTHTMLFILD